MKQPIGVDLRRITRVGDAESAQTMVVTLLRRHLTAAEQRANDELAKAEKRSREVKWAADMARRNNASNAQVEGFAESAALLSRQRATVKKHNYFPSWLRWRDGVCEYHNGQTWKPIKQCSTCKEQEEQIADALNWKQEYKATIVVPVYAFGPLSAAEVNTRVLEMVRLHIARTYSEPDLPELWVNGGPAGPIQGRVQWGPYDGMELERVETTEGEEHETT